MMIHKFISKLACFIALAAVPFIAHAQPLEPYHTPQAFGKLSASSTIPPLVIADPQPTVPSSTGWQAFPVDTFSTSSHMSSSDPTTATVKIHHSGTYLVNALLTLQYPTPGTDGPADFTNYCIGFMINGQLQSDSIGSFHISTEGGHENPGLLFSATLSSLVALDAKSTVQFVVVAASPGANSPAFMNVISANATLVRVGHN